MEMCHESIASSQTTALPIGNTSSDTGERHTICVWLIDDDDEIRELVADLLNRQSRIVCPRQFSTTDEALEALEHEIAPDSLLLDVNLGRQNGIEAIRPIKARAPSTKVLMFTTFFDGHVESAAREAGAAGFLLKSYEVQEIVRLIIAADEGNERAGLFCSRSLRTKTATLRHHGGVSANPNGATRHRKPLGLLRALASILTL
jgi:DNA-binding NarL/FixJ family response regulator